MMTWLVTGGAGYIGSHVSLAFRQAGIEPVVLDDLSAGRPDFVLDDVTLVHGSTLDGELVRRTLRDHHITGVVHLAGYKYAGESVHRPLHTYRQNVTGTATLLEAMTAESVDLLVFSSSAAVYGTPDTDLVTEDTPKHPESPYGESKLIAEWLIRDVGIAHGLKHTSLRYFNVVGSGDLRIRDISPYNLFPKVFDALAAGRTPVINGDDYPTPDGTNIRDYLHVADLAAAHVVAAQRLEQGLPIEPAYNLGSGDGVSVKEIMTAIARVTGTRFDPEITARRPGDPARIVASGDLAARDLEWRMRHTLDDMIESAWQARLTATR